MCVNQRDECEADFLYRYTNTYTCANVTGPAHPSKQRAMASTTESSCTTQTVQGTHRFQICQFSYGNVGSEDYIRSGIFRVGGFDWVIVYCQDADGDDGEGSWQLWRVVACSGSARLTLKHRI